MRLGTLYIITILSFLLGSCEHDNIENLLGPDLEGTGLLCPPDDFEIDIESTNTKKVNLATEVYSVEYKMNSKVTWELGVIGSNTAFYSQNGFGTEINATWDGSTTNNIFFKQGDTVRTYVLFNCLDTLWTNKLVIETTKVYDVIMISDFDGQGSVSAWSNASNDLKLINSRASDSLPVAQGDRYLLMLGADIGKGSYLGQVISSPNPINYGLTASPDQLYFNALVRGSKNAQIEFRIYDGAGDTDEFYLVLIPVTWDGWQLLSIPYSDFIPGGSKENFDRDTREISHVRVTMRSDNPEPSVTLNVDFMCFTEGKPLQP